tara:strand:+ start:778 stop:1008 length:231 start_codon:yes stop_codon:yes gene_type:complete
MSKTNKLGPYVQKLMLIVVDREQDDDVKQLAWDELKRLSVDLNDFLTKNVEDGLDKIRKKELKKQLLQEDDNVSDK